MSQKILITTSSFDLSTPEIQTLLGAGYEIILNPHKRRLSEEEVRELLTPDVIGMIAGVEPLTADVLNNAEGLKVISRCGAGMDSVDQVAAKDNNIAVFNTPGAPAPAVAELTIGLMLDILRNISLQDRGLRNNEWVRPVGNLLGARTIGLIGFGYIGSLVAKFAHGFGAKILAYDPMAGGKTSDIAEFADMDTVLSTADIVSLHVPYNEDNHHLLDRARMEQMKEGAIVINTARGGLVDEDALHDLLQSGHLRAAGLDVFEKEPYQGPLSELENVVLTAHTGSYAKESRIDQERQAAQNLVDGLGLNKG